MQNAFFSLSLAIVVFIALAFYINKKFAELQKPQNDDAQKLMLDLITGLRRDVQDGQGASRKEMDSKLLGIQKMLSEQQNASTQMMQKQFKQSSEVIKEVTKNLTHLKETNKRVVDFAGQMQSLENILKNPKQRGILGEYALEALLSNHLHGNYEMQYKMANGEIVDAAIFFNNLIIPIDSKFSLEKYNTMMEENDKIRRAQIEKEFKADVKKRIDETSKYIRPSEGTTEFAFMFIPAEGVYYNLTIYSVGGANVNTRNLIEYAFEKRVVIVSPSSFFAYLQTVLQGMKALKMGDNLTQTLKGIEVLGKHVNAYEEYMKKLGKHLGTTVSTYNHASREFKKIDKDVYKLTEGATGGNIEVEVLEKPVE
ncbi:DNA recombination protein RmuC [Candidatus Peregrinibacteria bacterium]|jgi:DNA recombination protein RmuC|nr:DNA recombination protein RmuC [Candidatus Peregrinibacteria bacterium]MBT4631952.1 DNA recombination protein RmuC [Candidatus Peregrinibacteria bacterium]MBT5517147.1 DNA recombination protein RmuC [Candidatus Peregrinibacteria bacterium]MBT5823660.1 DNA recombination protein RmuC [Candidatus Peregrinibacteria bacterium]